MSLHDGVNTVEINEMKCEMYCCEMMIHCVLRPSTINRAFLFAIAFCDCIQESMQTHCSVQAMTRQHKATVRRWMHDTVVVYDDVFVHYHLMLLLLMMMLLIITMMLMLLLFIIIIIMMMMMILVDFKCDFITLLIAHMIPYHIT
jgi:hypothetical protein